MKRGAGKPRKQTGRNFIKRLRQPEGKRWLSKIGKFIFKFHLRKSARGTNFSSLSLLFAKNNFPALFVIGNSPWTVNKTNSG